MRPDPRILLSLAASVLFSSGFVAGCNGKDAAADDPLPPPATDPPAQTVPSRHPVVKFKGGAVYARDLSHALDLDRAEVCRELGQLDCVDDVHRVTLGGVAPYEGGVYEPLPRATVTAPIALDRVALSGCALRVDRDFDEPTEATIFKPAEGGGHTLETRLAAVDQLYRRLLLRRPTSDEREAVARFVEDLTGDDLDRRWAKLACFAIATTTEATFY